MHCDAFITASAHIAVFRMEPFNHSFDDAFMAEVIKCVQDGLGCFACNSPNAKLRCSRCKVAVCELVAEYVAMAKWHMECQ